jgi:hypothetical protein
MQGGIMKYLTLSLGLLLTCPVVMSAEETKVDPASATVSGGNAYVKDATGKTIQMEEDTEYKTIDGKEIEYDKDPLGDNEIEVDD